MKKIIALSLFTPFLAFAATVGSILDVFAGIIDQIAPILFALAFIYFLWNIVKYIEAGGDPKKRDEIRDSIIITIILLFVMVSVWGLIGVVGDTLDVDEGTIIPIQPPSALGE